MNTVVWKFPIEIGGKFKLEMPHVSRIIHVAMQGDTPCMWVLCSPDNPQVERTFTVHGTGHPVERNENYIGTFLTPNGTYVWHVFEVFEP